MTTAAADGRSKDAYAASLFRSREGAAAIEELYQAAMSRLGGAVESRMVPTHVGDTHVLTAGPIDAQPVLVLPGGNFLNPTCLEWFLPLAQHYRLYAPEIVGQPGRSERLSVADRAGGRADGDPREVDRLAPGAQGRDRPRDERVAARTVAARRCSGELAGGPAGWPRS